MSPDLGWPSWRIFLKKSFSRWLREVLVSSLLQREDYGSHPYKLGCTVDTEAEGQTWSHLIFACIIQEAWPAWVTSLVSSASVRKSTNSTGETKY